MFFVALAVCACASLPPSFATTSASPDATFSCALAAVNQHGYMVTTSERAGGLIKAELKKSSAFTGTYFRELNISIYADSSGKTALRQ
jgi:hypothetical protein